MTTQKPILKPKTTETWWLFNCGTCTYRFPIDQFTLYEQERWESVGRGSRSFHVLNKFSYPPMEGLSVGDRFEIKGELIEFTYQKGRVIDSRLIERKTETFEMASDAEAVRVVGTKRWVSVFA